jgi:predicted enzyme related to lactoylglutathione lyase
LGLVKKQDISMGKYRWLTVVSSEEPDGAQLVFEPNDNPAAKDYQQAIYKQGKSATMFFVDDVQKEYDRIMKLGVVFTMKPTKTPGSTIAVLDDTCGNLTQLTQLSRPM